MPWSNVKISSDVFFGLYGLQTGTTLALRPVQASTNTKPVSNSHQGTSQVVYSPIPLLAVDPSTNTVFLHPEHDDLAAVEKSVIRKQKRQKSMASRGRGRGSGRGEPSHVPIPLDDIAIDDGDTLASFRASQILHSDSQVTTSQDTFRQSINQLPHPSQFTN